MLICWVIVFYVTGLWLFVRASRSGARANADTTHDPTIIPTEGRVPETRKKSSEWLSMLPTVFHDDPEVIVTLVPDQAKWVETTHRGNRLGLVELPHTGQRLGIQVLEPALNEWIEHASVMHLAGFEMAKPVYVGRLSGLPQAVLMHEGMCPVFVLRHDMHVKFWNIKAAALHEQGAPSERN